MVPTTAGSGSQATPNSILLVPEDELKVGIVSAKLAPYVMHFNKVGNEDKFSDMAQAMGLHLDGGKQYTKWHQALSGKGLTAIV